jgi:histidinol-phosphate aminotransferase
MSRFWSKTVKGLTPYTPGEQPKITNLIKLNTNENPYGPSLKAIAAIASANNDSLRLYPPPDSEDLKAAIATTYALNPNQVFVGNGSDEVLAHIFQALLKHESPLLFPDITYSFYPVYCKLYDIPFKLIPLDSGFSIQIEDFLNAGKNGGIIFPNPNAPTGLALPLAAIRTLLEKNQNSVVVIDEAYVDFGTESATTLITEFDNLIVTHSLSKSRALAGLRIGYAMGHHELIEGLERVKNSFNSYPIDRLASAGGIAAIKDEVYLKQVSLKIQSSREKLVLALQKLGFNTIPSTANFIFTHHPTHDGKVLYQALRDKNILVRHFNLPRIDQYLRITVGTDQECETLLLVLKEILSSTN